MPISTKANELSEAAARGLVVTHGSVIREFLNVVHFMKGEPIEIFHGTRNTAVYNIRFQRDASGALMPEILLSNDDSHTRDT